MGNTNDSDDEDSMDIIHPTIPILFAMPRQSQPATNRSIPINTWFSMSTTQRIDAITKCNILTSDLFGFTISRDLLRNTHPSADQLHEFMQVIIPLLADEYPEHYYRFVDYRGTNGMALMELVEKRINANTVDKSSDEIVCSIGKIDLRTIEGDPFKLPKETEKIYDAINRCTTNNQWVVFQIAATVRADMYTDSGSGHANVAMLSRSRRVLLILEPNDFHPFVGRTLGSRFPDVITALLKPYIHNDCNSTGTPIPPMVIPISLKDLEGYSIQLLMENEWNQYAKSIGIFYRGTQHGNRYRGLCTVLSVMAAHSLLWTMKSIPLYADKDVYEDNMTKFVERVKDTGYPLILTILWLASLYFDYIPSKFQKCFEWHKR